jgi:hypothetical protein
MRRFRLARLSTETEQSANDFGWVAASGLCRTYGAPDLHASFPGLPAWANLCRAYGAGLLHRERRRSTRAAHLALLRRLRACVGVCGFRTCDGLLDWNIAVENDPQLDGRTLEPRREMWEWRRCANCRHCRGVECFPIRTPVDFRIRAQESSVCPNLYDNGNEPGLSCLHGIWQRSNPIALD